ncbi:MAG: c-type cytochrome [Burkholderiales bacterium]|nr:MAG: c-type cytochrome [Burkholderiales bacterium]
MCTEQRARRVLAALVLAFAGCAALARQAPPWAGIGRPATAAEVAAWDIDVRPDFRGLPPGSGSVAEGTEVWESKCMDCHGIFGESNEVSTPIVGGTTDEDIATGRVASLRRPDYPQLTTLMKLSQISTLWDYIRRAMPWTAPKSLTVDEVYAVTAHILNLGDIVPDDFVLSDRNMAEVQALLPNRNGMFAYEPMWRVDGQGDVRNVACMKDCETEIDIRSFLPDYARDSHGNLSEQNRTVGPVRGLDTRRASPREPVRLSEAAPAAAAAPAVAAAGMPSPDVAAARELATRSACLTCHDFDRKIVGPALRDVAERYRGQADARQRLVAKVRSGGQGAWGSIPMPRQSHLNEEQLRLLVGWILAGAE